MRIPIRSMLCAPKGRQLLSIDLSQAESWCVAYFANEPTMKLELQFGDIHTRTARSVLEVPVRPISDEERYVGKRCNHAFNYLMGPERAAEVINKEGQVVVTVKQTKKFRQRYLELYRIEPWWLDVESVLKSKHQLVTPYGFHRRFYNTGKESLKEAIAFLPQSTIADHMYGRVQPGGREGGLRCVYECIIKPSRGTLKLVHSAHDSCIIEFPSTTDAYGLYGEVRKYLKRPMVINGEEFTIPTDCKVGCAWEEMEKLKEVA